MQRLIHLGILCCVFAFYCGNVRSQNKQELNIKASVSAYEEISYNPNNHERTEIGRSQKRFDAAGNVIGDVRGDFTYAYEGDNKSQMFVGTGENKVLVCTYKYNKNKLVEIVHHAGQKLEEQIERFYYYPNNWERRLFSYDEKLISNFLVNEQKKTVRIDISGLTFICSYKDYFWRPKTSKMLTCRGCKRQESREAIIRYDKHGNVLYISNYVKNLRINGEIVSSFSANFDPKGDYVLHYKYVYDSVGNWTERKCYNNEGRLMEWKERNYAYKQNERDNTFFKGD